MGLTKYLKKLYRSKEYKQELKKKLILWRKENVITKIKRPTRLDRAHALGWKAKQGFILVRTKIGKGTSKRETPSGGRKPLRAGKTKHTPKMNLQHIAEMRVARKFPNLEVLNSYYVAEDGKHKWYEVILVDPNHPAIKKDKTINWIKNQTRRVFRGLTSAGKRSRGLGRGMGFEHKK
ncbi:MAG: 50S ribosomal protein L15e [Candidatus Aenigmarchaeota archaeon]|nr:50S ribosomal protein L15e [Candidatus Aenigmarchaeota archaeon]